MHKQISQVAQLPDIRSQNIKFDSKTPFFACFHKKLHPCTETIRFFLVQMCSRHSRLIVRHIKRKEIVVFTKNINDIRSQNMKFDSKTPFFVSFHEKLHPCTYTI